jgi:hypothetical protein
MTGALWEIMITIQLRMGSIYMRGIVYIYENIVCYMVLYVITYKTMFV